MRYPTSPNSTNSKFENPTKNKIAKNSSRSNPIDKEEDIIVI